MVQQSDRKLQESLSALMDNEASELELHRLLKAAESDPCLRDAWQNYHLAAGAMRGDTPGVVPVDLSLQISAAIADEPAHSVGKPQSAIGKIWSAAGRMAVAASVAGAVVIGAQQYLATQAPMVAKAPETVGGAAGVVPDGFQAPTLNTRTVNISDGPALAVQPERATVSYQPNAQQNQAIEQHLNQLMLEHAENASQNSAQGLLPYARITPNAEAERPQASQDGEAGHAE
ncbi:sigma-E factor negative regulatory protein [Simiduia sp. 21SJ11W-1]|uniref:sigma-E factor negative regulatory protein n=1 Tax=Simiduia sp. 21SJ11W-1 TaxID=2909669 RepID=UPI00209D7A65|nr:sigma-E factor negative regulatory protein [Simiduia sp. 21SJ11W-1]UTA46290.1 sigma-E factor negative regulatory protein [Simiduia sp. 21SJ11W-1]